jgi:acetyltransferase-like isoleucine patch superfamily enzyme
LLGRIIDRLFGGIRAYKFRFFSNLHFSGGICYIGPFSLVRNNNGNISLGKKFYCRDSLRVVINNGKLHIGDFCFVNSNVSFNCLESITVGHNCLFGENVKLYDHDHDIRSHEIFKNSGYVTKPIVIGNNVWIGSNVTILKGVEIGSGSVVGAGSIVTKNIPANKLYFNKLSSVIGDIKKI